MSGNFCFSFVFGYGNVCYSLPHSRFLDVTQRSQFQFCTIDLKSHLITLFGGALRDIQKTAAREALYATEVETKEK